MALVIYQYFRPEPFFYAYPTVATRYFDICSGYFFVTLLIYFTINYIRRDYAFEKTLSDEKTRSIIGQQQFIVSQNKELANLNERFEYVTTATFDAIWDWNIATNALFWGKGYQTIFGYEPGETTTNFAIWQTRVHPGDAKRVLKTLQTAIATPDQHFWEAQYRYLKADKTYAYVMDRATCYAMTTKKPSV